MNIIAVIQARLGSTRLPKKVLLPLGDRSVLEWVVTRVKGSSLVNETVVATTMNKEDLEIVKVCADMGVLVYCGSQDNVLDRYYQVGNLLKADHVVRITADCPLIDPNIIDKIITMHLEAGADFTCNTIEVTYPDGEDVEIFKFDALKKAWENASLKIEVEHVTPYVKNRPDIFKLVNLEHDRDLSNKRWTLDNAEDYTFMKIIIDNLYKGNPLFSMEEILEFLEKNPHIETINQHIIRNEGYYKQIKKENVFIN